MLNLNTIIQNSCINDYRQIANAPIIRRSPPSRNIYNYPDTGITAHVDIRQIFGSASLRALFNDPELPIPIGFLTPLLIYLINIDYFLSKLPIWPLLNDLQIISLEFRVFKIIVKIYQPDDNFEDDNFELNCAKCTSIVRYEVENDNGICPPELSYSRLCRFRALRRPRLTIFAIPNHNTFVNMAFLPDDNVISNAISNNSPIVPRKFLFLPQDFYD